MYSNNLVVDIIKYIDININSKITIESLSYKFYYNRHYIMKLFKKEIGITIFDYINKIRIYNSIKEINNTNNLLIKIALNNGFYSLEYFSEIFKKEIGISPREYKKFFSNPYYYTDNKYIKVKNNLINLTKLMNNIQIYKQNIRRIDMPIKKYSIFN